nr:hypothetical protein [Candidatus Neomarinimicrobiota bacterium]
MVKGLKVSGRMSVGRFEKEFEDEFGVKCQIKDCGKLADDNATLASLRPEDFKGPKVVDFSPSGNMLVKNVKKKFTKNFGANIQFYYKNRVVLEDITFGELQRGEVKKDNDPAESVNIEQNESVSSTNNRALTEEQINDLKNTEEKSTNSNDYRNLADDICEAGDKEWAIKVYKKAEEKAEDVDDLQALAESIAKTLGDKEWARKVYKKAEEKAEDGRDLHFLAESIAETLGDKEWATKLFKKAEEKAEDVDDLQALAESIAKTLGDKEWARKVYKKAEEKAEDVDDLQALAESIAKTLGDKEWARKVYKKAEEKAEDVDDLQALAE